jgi:hypothetical protein
MQIIACTQIHRGGLAVQGPDDIRK